MQKAFGSLNAQPTEESIAEAQQLFAETQGLYMKAIETEGNALEAMAQCAQVGGFDSRPPLHIYLTGSY